MAGVPGEHATHAIITRQAANDGTILRDDSKDERTWAWRPTGHDRAGILSALVLAAACADDDGSPESTPDNIVAPSVTTTTALMRVQSTTMTPSPRPTARPTPPPSPTATPSTLPTQIPTSTPMPVPTATPVPTAVPVLLSGPTPILIVTPQPFLAAERAALVAFNEATGGDDYCHKWGWLRDDPVGEWNGVTTDEEGRVTAIEFEWAYLTGYIPPEIGNLTHLRTLRLVRNKDMRGELPPEIGNLTNLRELIVEENGLRGQIPPELGRLRMAASASPSGSTSGRGVNIRTLADTSLPKREGSLT